ncbi:Type II secretion system protein G precursor [Roseovarius litorisediminis]|uniref:Type II secretion system core protein G n=2 Tax=Roseovarius litorisediminis TaxID=1312363 RepID=A0A1Y5SXZ2_9RHOB|nr:Type II secretion system protein G precursor [Roseovarius litorisediminis]
MIPSEKLYEFRNDFTMQINASRNLQTQSQSSEDEGFSLLELMVVVVIMSILALVVMPRIIDRPDQARVARVKSDLAVLNSAVKLYKLDNYRYPTTEQGLMALVEAPTTEPVPKNWAQNGYIDRLPKDPWGNDYQYLQPGVHDQVDIFTLGADGVSGGTGLDADIGTWTEE